MLDFLLFYCFLNDVLLGKIEFTSTLGFFHLTTLLKELKLVIFKVRNLIFVVFVIRRTQRIILGAFGLRQSFLISELNWLR